ncbi:hypothetical protein ACS0TY_028398 [Phlomoides rotata]
MEELSCFQTNGEIIELPPGFRFHPTDEELITHYLVHKVVDSTFITKVIGEVDLNKVEPWDLPWKAKMGEKEWYFFCVRDRKYPTGLRTNRATEAGYWKATGKDREIYRAKILVGMKKTLVFYRGRAPRGEKTNWVMHEYRLEGKHSMHNLPKNAKNEWVMCRIFKKTSGGKKENISGLLDSTNRDDDSQSSDLPPLMDLSSDGDKLFDEFTSLKKRDFSFTFPQVSAPNSVFLSETIPRIEASSTHDSFLMQDSSVLRLLLEENASNAAQNAKTEVSQGVSYDEAGFRPCYDQEFPVVSTATTDLDCLWDY